MRFTVEGIASSVLPSKPRWGGGTETVRLKLELNDGILRSKHKSYSISIEIATNNIIDGQELINRLQPGNTHVRKMCPTCHFKINTGYGTGSTKKQNCFPALTMQSEELHYTLKGGKDVQISKYYRSGDPDKGRSATIRLNNKYLPPVPFDFNKFSDLEHLNKRLDTIILFH